VIETVRQLIRITSPAPVSAARKRIPPWEYRSVRRANRLLSHFGSGGFATCSSAPDSSALAFPCRAASAGSVSTVDRSAAAGDVRSWRRDGEPNSFTRSAVSQAELLQQLSRQLGFVKKSRSKISATRSIGASGGGCDSTVQPCPVADAGSAICGSTAASSVTDQCNVRILRATSQGARGRAAPIGRTPMPIAEPEFMQGISDPSCATLESRAFAVDGVLEADAKIWGRKS
jgi:hypothetical protein